MFTSFNLLSQDLRTEERDDRVESTGLVERLQRLFRRFWETLKSPGQVAGVRFFLDEADED